MHFTTLFCSFTVLFKTKTMKNQSQILVGGQALRQLGHDRNTDDIDYLIFDSSDSRPFIISNEVDYLNAGSKTTAGKFFNEIYNQEKGNEIASPQSLLELKAYAFVQHCQNFNFRKADACEYDMKFLVRKFNLTGVSIVQKYITSGEWSEVEKIINSVK